MGGERLSPERAAFLQQDFATGFPGHLGARAVEVGPGFWEAVVEVRPEHLQQDGFVHAGVLATLADHSAGYAAFTLVPADRRILTIEFKINFLRPAVGERLRCRARVVRPGRTVLVAQSEVWAEADGAPASVALAQVTLMAVPAERLGG